MKSINAGTPEYWLELKNKFRMKRIMARIEPFIAQAVEGSSILMPAPGSNDCRGALLLALKPHLPQLMASLDEADRTTDVVDAFAEEVMARLGFPAPAARVSPSPNDQIGPTEHLATVCESEFAPPVAQTAIEPVGAMEETVKPRRRKASAKGEGPRATPAAPEKKTRARKASTKDAAGVAAKPKSPKKVVTTDTETFVAQDKPRARKKPQAA